VVFLPQNFCYLFSKYKKNSENAFFLQKVVYLRQIKNNYVSKKNSKNLNEKD